IDAIHRWSTHRSARSRAPQTAWERSVSRTNNASTFALVQSLLVPTAQTRSPVRRERCLGWKCPRARSRRSHTRPGAATETTEEVALSSGSPDSPCDYDSLRPADSAPGNALVRPLVGALFF